MAAIDLKDATIPTLARPESGSAEYWDTKTPGLCLRVTSTGVRTWTVRFRVPGSASFRRKALGHYRPGTPDHVSLAKAREKAWTVRAEAKSATPVENPTIPPPRTVAGGERLRTLGDLAPVYIDRYAKTNKRSWANDLNYLATHLVPMREGRAPTYDLSRLSLVPRGSVLDWTMSFRAEVARALDAITASGAPTSANRTQTVLIKALNWAVESGYMPMNPVAGMRKRAPKSQPRTRVLDHDEIRVLWHALERARLTPSTRHALQLILLTGQRPGEVAGMARAELVAIDKPGARWDIPAARMKANRPHKVPLAPHARALILQAIDDNPDPDGEHVFGSRFESVDGLARHSMSQALRRVIRSLEPSGPDAEVVARLKRTPPRPHDLRRTVATELDKLGIAREYRLAALSHEIGDIHARHYDHADPLPHVRDALEKWEARLMEIFASPAPETNVIAFRGR